MAPQLSSLNFVLLAELNLILLRIIEFYDIPKSTDQFRITYDLFEITLSVMENLTFVQELPNLKHLELLAYDFEMNLRQIVVTEIEGGVPITEWEHTILGSTVEIPVRNCVSTIEDLDRMQCITSSFAFFEDLEDLDDELVEKFNHRFHSKKYCFKILPDDIYSGYVNVYLLDYIVFTRSMPDSEGYKYHIQPCRPTITPTDMWKNNFHMYELPYQECELRGPVRKNTSKVRKYLFVEDYYDTSIEDVVYALHCLTWPPDASEWVTYQRKYGWPDEQTIKEIVENGCHIVPVAHDDCRSDVYQWGISFSEAEVILMKSLSQKQQHIHNFLRHFIKKEIIKEEFEESGKILSTYMIKTLMLWHCEQKSAKWWRNTESVEVCCYLLKKLLNWLIELNCRNYFITDCNLFPKQLNLANADFVIQKLTESTEAGYLNRWYEEKYYPDYCKQELLILQSIQHTLEPTWTFEKYFLEERDLKQIWSVINSSETRETTESFLSNAHFISHMTSISRVPVFASTKNVRPLKGILGSYAPNIDSVNAPFTDYYKAHVMLQVAAIARTYTKHDLAFGMICSLFVDHSNKTSPLPRNSSAVQMISRQLYYVFAKQVLIGRTTCNNPDHFVSIKLAKILIKKELRLVGTDKCDPRAYSLRLHLAVINLTFTPNSNTFLICIASKPPDYKQSNAHSWIDGRYLLFSNDVVVAIALQNLIKHVKSKRNIIVKSIPISLSFFRKYLFFCHTNEGIQRR